jgi:hypothetical protein
MKAASMIGFIAGLLIIALVVLANAEASTRSYSYGDREPCTEDHLVRPLVEKKHHACLDDRGSRRQVEDRFQSIDDRKTATELPKDQPLDKRSTGPSPHLTAMAPRRFPGVLHRSRSPTRRADGVRRGPPQGVSA